MNVKRIESNKQMSSMNAERIESSEHILTGILVLLPPKSIFRFMCVSKRWNNIINDPFFRRSYSRRRHLLSLFEKTRITFGPTNMLHIRNSGNHIKPVPRSLGCLINSSYGLILCCSNATTYNVVNPEIGKWVSQPPPPGPPPPPPLPHNVYYNTSSGLMCEENTSELIASYIIIRALGLEQPTNLSQMQTYSSKTGEWTQSTLVATGKFVLLHEAPMLANGVFHWFAWWGIILVFDPTNNDQNAQLIQLPRDVNTVGRSSDDILWLGRRVVNVGIKLWMLPKGEGGSYKRATTIPKEGGMDVEAQN